MFYKFARTKGKKIYHIRINNIDNKELINLTEKIYKEKNSFILFADNINNYNNNNNNNNNNTFVKHYFLIFDTIEVSIETNCNNIMIEIKTTNLYFNYNDIKKIKNYETFIIDLINIFYFFIHYNNDDNNNDDNNNNDYNNNYNNNNNTDSIIINIKNFVNINNLSIINNVLTIIKNIFDIIEYFRFEHIYFENYSSPLYFKKLNNLLNNYENIFITNFIKGKNIFMNDIAQKYNDIYNIDNFDNNNIMIYNNNNKYNNNYNTCIKRLKYNFIKNIIIFSHNS